jgi:hypothetical protein
VRAVRTGTPQDQEQPGTDPATGRTDTPLERTGSMNDKIYHGNSAGRVTVGVWEDVYDRLHEEATRTGWSMMEVASMILEDFFIKHRELPQKLRTRPRIEDFE